MWLRMAEKDKQRAERLTAALRENLRRRKSQARELSESDRKDRNDPDQA